MVPLDAFEQLHPARLQPEHADSVADLGPFGIEIVADEPRGEPAYLEPRRLGMAPLQRPAFGERDRAGEEHRLAREEVEVFGRFVAVPGLVEQAPAGAYQAVAANGPAVPCDAARLCRGQLQSDL